MSIFLEITQLENGDIVLREAEDDAEDQIEQQDGQDQKATAGSMLSRPPSREPLVRIRFSNEVKDMLGNELVDVAEAMIDAATDFLGSDSIEIEAEEPAPVIH